MAAARRHWWVSILSLLTTLALASVPLPDAVAPLRPDWVAVVLLYWSLMAPRHFSLMTAFWMGIALDTLTGALLGQNALALLVIVYMAEKFHLRLRVFPLSQLAITVLLLLGLYEFILFWIDGLASAGAVPCLPGEGASACGRTVPLAERWVPPLTGTLVWVLMYMMFDRREREAPARL
jgi:rod shape-determining protein MreD